MQQVEAASAAAPHHMQHQHRSYSHRKRGSRRARSVDDDLQLLAGDDSGFFQDVSADVELAIILNGVANDPACGIRTKADAAFWSRELSSPKFQTLVKDLFWWVYASMMDKRTRHRVLVPSSMTAAMHKQMFHRVSESFVGLCLRLQDCPRGIVRDRRRDQFLKVIDRAIIQMFLHKYRRSFASADDPLLVETSHLVNSLFTGSASGGAQTTPSTPAAAPATQRSAPKASWRAPTRTGSRQDAASKHHTHSVDRPRSKAAAGAGVDRDELSSRLNQLVVETDPLQKLPAVVAGLPNDKGDDDDAVAPVPLPVHLPPAVRMMADNDDAERGVAMSASHGSTSATYRRGSGIAAALRKVTGGDKTVVVKRESMPARSKPPATVEASTLLYSPLILNSLGGFAGGLTHASRHAVRLSMTNEHNDSQQRAEQLSCTAAGFTWDPERKHLVPASELPALPKPAPGTHAPPVTPREQTGTPWCSEGGSVNATATANAHNTPGGDSDTVGDSTFLTQVNNPRRRSSAARTAARRRSSATKRRANRVSSSAVLQMLHQAKRQMQAESEGPEEETLEDVLQASKQRKQEILDSYRSAQLDARRFLHHSVLNQKRTLKIVDGVRDTILAHSSGTTELSNHLTAMRSFQRQADMERRHYSRQRRQQLARVRAAHDEGDADIFDPDASPMLPVEQRTLDAAGQPKPPRLVDLPAEDRRNTDGNPALMRNMGIVPGSQVSTADPATKSLIVELHGRGGHQRGLRRSASAAPRLGSKNKSLRRPPRAQASAPDLHGGTEGDAPDTYTTLSNGIRLRGTIPSHLDPEAVAVAAEAALKGKISLPSDGVGASDSGAADGGDAGGDGQGSTTEATACNGGGGGGGGGGLDGGDTGSVSVASRPGTAHSKLSSNSSRRRKGRRGVEQPLKVHLPTPDGVQDRALAALKRQRQLLRVPRFEVAARRKEAAPMEVDVSVNDLMYIPELPAAQQATA